MKIQKLLHSCLRIEHDGRVLLIDPGSYTLLEGEVTLADLGGIDAVVYTHQHQDHWSADVLRAITDAARDAGRPAPLLAAEPSLAALMVGVGFADVRALTPGTSTDLAGFTLDVLDAPHEAMPTPACASVGLVVDRVLLHPGDSHTFTVPAGIRVFALPYVAPWETMVGAVASVRRVGAPTVVPIHDWMLRDRARLASYERLTGYLEGSGSTLHPLELGETLEVGG